MADDNVEYRVGQLEDDVTELKTDVKLILTNHLPHINESILELKVDITDMISGKIDKAFKWFVVALTVGCTVIGIMIKFIN